MYVRLNNFYENLSLCLIKMEEVKEWAEDRIYGYLILIYHYLHLSKFQFEFLDFFTASHALPKMLQHPI